MLTRASVVLPAWYIRKENTSVHDVKLSYLNFCVNEDQPIPEPS